MQFEALYFFARMRFEQGRIEEAAALFERAMGARPEDYQAPVLLGMARRSLGQEEGSLEALRRGLDVVSHHVTLNPDDARAYYLGGLACVRLGERQRGLEWALRALELEPDEPMVLYNVAGIYALSGESRPRPRLPRARHGRRLGTQGVAGTGQRLRIPARPAEIPGAHRAVAKVGTDEMRGPVSCAVP